MGYRSNVVIGFTRKFYKKNKKKLDELLEGATIQDNIDQVYASFEWTKWYDDYPEVAALQQLIEDNPKDTCLLRIGEEYDDIEDFNDCFNEFGLSITRTINLPEPEYDTKAKKILYAKKKK